ncbi:MAG TPA: phospholipase D-like domain-containing protein [Candidatus Acidoferrum sp.]|nr:phospholipase D-like domain-containing protein [Candidatus Acidoferrum sp.]
MKLIIEPDDGPAPLLTALKNARKSVEIAIFRFDRSDVETTLNGAAAKGVKVTALIADANRGGKKNLRRLETRFLHAGITVARSADDLVRYHDKLIVIDRHILYVLSFNFTHLDIGRSRGFGIVTKNTTLVREAVKLFEADCARRNYAAGPDTFVVSPVNSRRVLRSFLKRAKKQLLIYDPQISDREMIHILQERAKTGVEIRVIGRISGRAALTVRKMTRMRLHTRTIIRDGHQAFVGSQSLRPAELDSRREVGLIVRDSKIVKKLLTTFEADWNSDGTFKEEPPKEEAPTPARKKETEKALAVLVQELRPLTGTVKKAVKRVVAQAGEEVLQDKIVKSTVKKVIKKAVKKAVNEVAHDAEAASPKGKKKG